MSDDYDKGYRDGLKEGGRIERLGWLGSAVFLAIVALTIMWASTCRAESVRCDTVWQCPDGYYLTKNGSGDVFCYNPNARTFWGEKESIYPIFVRVDCHNSNTALDSLRSELARVTRTLDSLVKALHVQSNTMVIEYPDTTAITLRLLIEYLQDKYVKIEMWNGAWGLVPALPAELRGK